VTPGKAYLVGEKGPELFTPPSAGNIVPNGAMGMQSAPPQVNVSVVNVHDPDEAVSALNTAQGEHA
jgi:phage-related minor tail protein